VSIYETKDKTKNGDNVIPQNSQDTPNDGTGRVSFTVKELLTDISKKIDIIDVKLDSKAEKSIVETLDRRVAVIETTRNTEREAGLLILAEFRNLQSQGQDREKRLIILETSQKDKDAWKILWIPMIFNGLVSAAAILYGVITFHH
jgi:hypothetical protein